MSTLASIRQLPTISKIQLSASSESWKGTGLSCATKSAKGNMEIVTVKKQGRHTMQPVQRWADNQQQKRHDKRKGERPKKMGQDTRKQETLKPDSASKEDTRKGEVESQSAISDSTQLASRCLIQSRIAASRSDEGRKALVQEMKMAKAQFNAIKEESERLAEWFMAKAVQVRLHSQHIRIRAFSRQGVQTTRVSVSPAKGPKARE